MNVSVISNIALYCQLKKGENLHILFINDQLRSHQPDLKEPPIPTECCTLDRRRPLPNQSGQPPLDQHHSQQITSLLEVKIYEIYGLLVMMIPLDLE